MQAVIPFALLLASVIEAAPITPGPSTLASYNGWESAGCYVDSVSARTMPVTMATPGGAPAMTVEVCLDACHAAGYNFAGLEWSQECYCATALPPQQATDGRCDMACNGNSLEYCGGGNGLNVYRYTLASGPTNVQSYKSWAYDNCYVDSVANRQLPNTVYVPGAMTVKGCLDACDAAGFEYAGLEYSQECYCGRAAPPTLATDGRCDMTCNGNNLELCGGGNGLSVYHSSSSANMPGNLQGYDGWSFEGCFEDSVGNRVLPVRAAVEQDPQMTIERCLDACGGLGYMYAGLEYAQECWCGSSLPPVPATDGRCSMVCNGNSLELCGGGNGLDVYHHGSSFTSTSIETTLTTTTCSTATITTATTIVEPVTGTTTYGGPVTITTTFVAPATITTTYGAPVTLTTTIPVPLTASTTVPTLLTLTKTVPALVTGTSTIPGPFTYTTTIPVAIAGTTSTSVPVVGQTTINVPITTTSLSRTTAIYPSATLSVYTGTTSFVDAVTTIYQPVIILTTLVKTLTTTATRPIPFTTTSVDIEPFTSYSASLETFTTTSFDLEPATTTTFGYEPFTSTSFDIEPFTTTSGDIEVFTTTSFDAEPFTSTTEVVEVDPTSTTVVTDFTTTSFFVEPYTTTGFDASTTTVTTIVPAPLTVTTTIVTAVHATSASTP